MNLRTNMALNFLAGAVVGGLLIGSGWVAHSMVERAEFAQGLLAKAWCDPAGFVSVEFGNGSSFTCIPHGIHKKGRH